MLLLKLLSLNLNYREELFQFLVERSDVLVASQQSRELTLHYLTLLVQRILGSVNLTHLNLNLVDQDVSDVYRLLLDNLQNISKIHVSMKAKLWWLFIYRNGPLLLVYLKIAQLSE